MIPRPVEEVEGKSAVEATKTTRHATTMKVLEHNRLLPLIDLESGQSEEQHEFRQARSTVPVMVVNLTGEGVGH